MATEKEIKADGAKEPMRYCPFCGSYNVDPEGGLAQDGDGKPYTFPACDSCGASAPSIEKWNSRPITNDMRLRALAMSGGMLNDGFILNLLGEALSSTKELASYNELAELFGCETTLDYEELKKTVRIDTETGYWTNRHNGYFQHIRTADF